MISLNHLNLKLSLHHTLTYVRFLSVIMINKELIFNKTLKLFVIHGYDGITVSMICRKMGISKSSFLIHFANKEELFDYVLAKCNDMFLRENPTPALRKQLADTLTLKETLYFLMDKYILMWSSPMDRELWQVIFREQYNKKEAAIIILEETKSRVERLTATFDQLQKHNKMISCNSDLVAANYIYSVRAQYLNYIISQLFLPSSSCYTDDMYRTADMIADLYDVK